MTGRTLFTAADARDGNDRRNGLMVLAGTSIELPPGCGVTEIIAAIPDLYCPLMTTWPADLVQEFAGFITTWMEQNKRRVVAVTSATRRDPGGPVAIVVIHHVVHDVTSVYALQPATKPPAAQVETGDTRGGRMPAAAATSCAECR